MIDYAVLEILESFSREELKSFRKFIISPYFNRSKKVIKLFDAAAKFHPNYDHPLLTKEYLHSKVSPELPYNDITMRRLLFDLQSLAEKFVQQINFESKFIESRTFMIEELVNRGSRRMLDKNFKSSQKMISDIGHLNSDLCLSSFRMETDTFYYGMIHNRINKKSFVETESSKLVKGITYLIGYFMLEAIKHSDTLLTYSRSFNDKKNEDIITRFLEMFDFDKMGLFMKQHSVMGNYLIEVYLNALKSFLYFEEHTNYTEFKESLMSHKDKLSPADNSFLFSKLIAYGVTKTMYKTTIDNIYDRELFDVYKTVVNEKYYATDANKYFPPDLFRNIIIQATKIHELSWLEDFIENYSLELHPHRKSDVVNYSYARLYFERNIYDKSLAFLSKIKMDEFSYALDARSLYLKIYYDQGDYDAAYNYAKAYSKFLNGNSLISETRRESNLNFIRFVMKLINYHNEKSKTNLSALALQIEKCRELSILNRFWLAGKTATLEKSQRRIVG